MPDSHPLVCRFGAFGDMVMLTPMLQCLYQRSGKAVDIVGTGAWTQTLFQHMPWVRHVYTIGSRKTPYLFSLSKRRLAGTLRRQAHAFAWLCETNPHSYVLMKKSGIDTSRSVNAIDHPPQQDEHFAAQWLRLANLSPPGFDYAACHGLELDTRLFVSEQEIDECRHWLNARGIDDRAPLICIQAGNKRTTRKGRVDRASNTKYWPEQNWAKLIDAITDTLPDAHIMLCGVTAEYGLTQDIRALCAQPQRLHCVAGDLPLRRLLALLSIAHSCVSVDTGPAHAAAALNCPLTVLFGKADPRRYRPVSAHSKVMVVTAQQAQPDTSCRENKALWHPDNDISRISPDVVSDNWRRSIEQPLSGE